MKINKILAAGVAATLAVTSLSAVVSAEVQTKTFDVYRTSASFWNHSVKFNADVNKDIASKLRQADSGEIRLTQIDQYVRQVLNYEGFIQYLYKEGEDTKAAYYEKNPSAYNYGSDLFVGGISITATGYQHIGDTATVTKTFTFEHKGGAAPWNVGADKDGYWYITVLDDETPIYHDGEFCSYFFTEITSLQLEVKLSGSTGIEDEYNYWNWIGTDGNISNKRFVDLGDIAVIENRAVGTVNWTYGSRNTTANETFNGTKTDVATDLGHIIASQATEELYTVAAETANDGSTTGLGVVVGSSVLSTDVGSPLKTNQKVGVGTGTTVKNAPADAATAIDVSTDTTAEIKIEGAATTAPMVINNQAYATGKAYIYTITDSAAGKEAFYTTSKLTDTQLAAVKKVITDAQAATTPVDITPAAFKTATGYTLIVADNTAWTDVPLYNEVDKNDYRTIVPGAQSTETKDLDFATAGVVLYNANTGRYEFAVNAWGTPFTAMNLSDAYSTANLLAYAFANGGWFESKSQYGDYCTDKTELLDVTFPYISYTGSTAYNPYHNVNDNGLTGALSPATSKENGWIPKTTYESRKQIKNKIERDDVWLLSSTDARRSEGQTYGGVGQTKEKENQSYDATFWDGTQPYGFAGLASQVGDFFNKQDNGTITFTFAADAGNTAGKWTDGVPSTEVGLKGFTSEYLNDFALFFNYDNTTGTMLSAIKLDPTAGTVTFDISDYLSECGGLTKATLENIYYGLDNGIQKEASKNIYGLWVSKVELAYDDAGKAAVDATTDDDTAEDDAAVVVADDDDDDAEVEDDDVAEDDDIFEDDDVIEDDDDDDDDVDADVIEDDDDDDTDVNNDVDYVDAGADDDANPGTGVGLAVIPAIVAAAAVVVSKKRK